MAQYLPDSPKSPRFSYDAPDSRRSHETTEAPNRRSIISAKIAKGRPSLELLSESSPLLSPELDGSGDGRASPIPGTPSGMLDWGEDDGEESKSLWYLFVLTLSIGG